MTETDVEIPTTVADLPPSSHLVYLKIDVDGALLFEEIYPDLQMHQSTARGALDRLLDAGAVDRRRTPRAPRGFEYYIPDGGADASASGSDRAIKEDSQT